MATATALSCVSARPARLPPDARENTSSLVTVELVTREADFAALAVPWDRIHDQAVAASIFNSWLWQYQWWRVYGGNQPLRILVAKQHGETVGILALYVHTVKALRIPVRVLRMVGTGGDTHPDDLGPVLAPGCEKAAVSAMAEAVLQIRGVDVLMLSDLDSRSDFRGSLECASLAAGLPGLKGCSERIVYVDLPPAWENFLSSLSANRRAQLRGARRKLAAAQRTRFFVWDDAAGLDRALDGLAQLHRKRWAVAGGSDSFATAEYLQFHRRIVASFLPRGWLRLYCLETDGEVSAMTYCYRFRNRVFLVQAGFDPDKASWKPGSVLLGYALEHAIGEGNEAFDFLRGEHRYKDQLATGSRETGFIVVFRRSLGAFAFRLRRVFLPAMRKRIRPAAGRNEGTASKAPGSGFPVVPYPSNRKLTQ